MGSGYSLLVLDRVLVNNCVIYSPLGKSHAYWITYIHMYEKTHLYLIICYHNSIDSKFISSIYDKTTMISTIAFLIKHCGLTKILISICHIFVYMAHHARLISNNFNWNQVAFIEGTNLQILWALFKFYKPKMRCKKIRDCQHYATT